MGVLNLILGLSCLGLALASPQDPLDWEQRWTALDRLSAGEDAPLRASLTGDLEQLQGTLHGQSSALER